MNLTDLAREILEGAGYRTYSLSSRQSVMLFEDTTLLGFVAAYPNVMTLLEDWRKENDAFVRGQASAFRQGAVKAWNAYAVFLTPGSSPVNLQHELLAIEEDFGGTRKLVRYGLVTRDDVLRALYPLLPIQTTVALSEADARDRLRGQLEQPARVMEALLGMASATELAEVLLAEVLEEE